MIENYFSEEDRAAVAEATKDAERRTSGELVCYIVERCGVYRVAAWRLAFTGGVLAALAAAFWCERIGNWGAPDHVWVVIAFGNIVSAIVYAVYYSRARFLQKRI